MARPITEVVNEGEALGVVGGVAASITIPDAAADVAIADAGAYFTGTDVEAALQELGAGGGGGTIAVEDEGVETVAAASRLDFVGAGVTVTDAGSGQATVTIPGGGGTAHKFVRSTSGTTSINTSSAWANLSTYVASFTDLVLTGCSVGDVIEAELTGIWDSVAFYGQMDVATIVSGTVTNCFSSGTGTPESSGVPNWFADVSKLFAFGGAARYTLKSGDISTGSVTFRARVNTTGARILIHRGGQFSVKNLGPVQS